MLDYVVSVYCFVDDYVKITHPKKLHERRKQNDAEIITTAIIAARYFGGNLLKARHYMYTHHGVKKIHKSNFNRHLHRLNDLIISLFIGLGRSLKSLNTDSEYLIDSFPVAVCKNIRIKRCKLLQGEAYRGYNVSKREYFYGFKVLVITTADGIPVEYFIFAGKYHDMTGFKSMDIDLPKGSKLFGDSAFTDYEIEDLYKECEDIHLMIERKSNSTRLDSPAQAFIKKYMRKRIETTFGDITMDFPKRIHAVTPQGFLLKILLFLFAYSLNRSV